MESKGKLPATRRAIGLSGIKVYGHIGYLLPEREVGRLFRVDIRIEYQQIEEGTDPLIDYREIAKLIQTTFSAGGMLIEKVAEQIGQAILTRWDCAEKVEVWVHKIHPPITILAQSAYAYVEMVRG
ncbi:MAG: dihydroneopterin aldolase [Bacteroidia bacterium]|nr:dihydroneopterin aldolase [Bacteroidia bacterium]MDW8134718.1 dihydroneopterin aldolase [Bacteroidia bacterium]